MGSKNIISKSFASLKWNYLGVAARVVLQLVAQIALARLVGPEAFGSASAAIFVMIFASILVELGLGSSLVQRKNLSADDMLFAFRRILIASFVAGFVMYFFAAAISSFWGDPLVAPLLQVLVIALVAQASGIVSVSYLKRELDFKWIQISQIMGYFVGYIVVGVAVAVMGGGSWSLVAAWVGQTVFTTILLYWRVRHPVNILRSTTCADQNLQTYGLRILFTNIANWMIENIDNFMVGRAFGTSALGVYTVSYNLVRTPTNHLVTSIQQVLFPVSARTQASIEGHRLTYLVIIWGVSLIAFPVFFSVAGISATVIDALYGNKWGAAAGILLPLAIAMPFHAVMAVGGPILWGRGEAGREMRVQIFVAIALVIVLASMMNLTPAWMAWGVAGVYVLRAIWMQSQVAKALQLNLILVLWSVLPGLIVGSVIACILMISDHYWLVSAFGSVFRLLAAVLLGSFLAGLMLFLIHKLLPSSIRIGLVGRTDLPNMMRRMLRLA